MVARLPLNSKTAYVPISISIQGFKSFKKKQKYEFPKSPGFYFLTGTNVVEPELEGNGVGKSGFFDALIWVLYNRTARGMKASDVGNWERKQVCEVVHEFCVGEEHFVLKRTWSPNSLQWKHNEDGEYRTIEQRDIDHVIRLDFNSFLYAIVFGQFNDSFLDLKPAAKSELLSKILDLSQWEGYSKAAKNRVTWLEGLHHDCETEISECKGQIQGLNLTDYKVFIEEWEEKHRKSLKESIDLVIHAQKELGKLKTEGERLVKEKERLSEDLNEFNEVAQTFQKEKQTVKGVEQEILTETGGYQGQIKVFNQTLTRINRLGPVCSECLQVIPATHKEQETTKIKQKIAQIKAKIDENQQELSEIEGILSEITQDLSEITQELEEIQSEHYTLNLRLSTLKTQSSALISTLTRANVSVKALRAEENPYIAAQEQQKKRVKALEETIKENKTSLEHVDVSLVSYGYWVKGFKEVRLFIISEILAQLELEVNNALYQLGLQNAWRIEFGIDKVNKSGSVRKGFSVFVHSPYNSAPVAWESWSGGESQRLRLAGILGLSNLILARNGLDGYLEVFDEPSSYLSAQGIEDLLVTLQDRVQEDQKQIFLIDHRHLDTIKFDGILKVVKDAEGSYFEVN